MSTALALSQRSSCICFSDSIVKVLFVLSLSNCIECGFFHIGIIVHLRMFACLSLLLRESSFNNVVCILQADRDWASYVTAVNQDRRRCLQRRNTVP